MNNRREFLRVGLVSLAGMAMPEQREPAEFGIKTISTWDLPSVSLNRWQATMRELTFPPGLSSPKHTHPGFVVGYVLQGEFRFHIEDKPEMVLSVGETFYEPPGAIHLPSGSASATKPARVLVVGFGEKGKDFTRLL